MANCLVTGGAGFIGSHIVEELVRRNHRVRVFDNLSTGRQRNLAPVSKDIEFLRGDLRDLAAVRKAARDVCLIFHVGAIRAVERSVDDPFETNDVNARGTLHVLLAARDEGAKRVIYSSSSAVYGESSHYPMRETDKPEPVSPYAVCKLMGEYHCRIFTELYKLETVSLRYFNVFGPRQNPESKYSMVIPMLIYRMIHGKSPEIHWDGKQTRDFHYIDSVVEANLLAAEALAAVGQVCNIASGEEHSVLDIFNEMKRILKKPSIRPCFKPKRPGDVRRTLGDSGKARKLLGFQVKTRFREGLEKTVEWFLESGVLEGMRT